jgi:hypothetical protein
MATLELDIGVVDVFIPLAARVGYIVWSGISIPTIFNII